MISATSDHIVTVCLDFPSPECCESVPVGDVAATPCEGAVFEVLACGSLCMMVKLPWKTLDAKGGVGIAGTVAYKIVAMTVLLLDPRWPEQIPLEVFSGVYGPVSYTEEVPVSVRWSLGDIISGTDPVGQGLLVSTNEADQRVLDRLDRGERVIAARSRDDQLHIARQVMQRARDIGEFELLQTHKTLVPYLREEVAELADVIESAETNSDIDDGQLVRELGDVLLQLLFHAELGRRRQAFSLDDVAASFIAKMRSRAPYLFDGTSTVVSQEDQDRLWAEGKRAEQARG
ncbi:MazG nucleotide pyrophosphohydrolase domain-containing protein [Corynebacterium sp. MSK297]|uniref:MazG nucleotide pyrophosphohydrolase domain-containing protein n=1 Tax=Corynebacterium sp. MSK297 TaxID=3050221 RepID=UPI003312F88A